MSVRISLDSILARLDEHEKYITALNSNTANGWQPTVAWNPKEVFEVSKYDADLTGHLESFVASQQQAGRIVIGYLSYDFGCAEHNVTLITDDDLHTPIVFAAAFDNWITFVDDSATLHCDDKFHQEVKAIMSRPPLPVSERLYSKPLSPVLSQDAYNKAYKKVHQYIEAGDIYQANLTHRLEGTTKLSGIDIYRHLSPSSGADFQSYIGGDRFDVISMSPERFIRIGDNVIETSPIKGTRPRGTTPQEDASIEMDLRENTKERAELDMITDLMRNDLGVVAEIGSVKVIDERVLTAYPTLWHAHSLIRARLRADVSPIAALAALMPGGSITGCPKKRAMEIIDELEVKRRGIYTGAVFVVQPTGELDSNIAIRTMIKQGEDVYLSVGGGIVYDSDQSDEYQESLQKAASFLEL